MSETFDPTLRRVYIPTGNAPPAPAAEDNPYVPVGTASQEQPPTWYGRASNALLSLLDQVGVAGLPEGEHRERVKTARNKLLHIGPMEEQDYLWPERMARSAVTLAGDVRTGNVPPPGLRREDYTDIPADPSKVGGTPYDDLIQRVQDMAGLAMSGGLAGTGAGGVALGSGPVPVARHFKDVSYPHAKMERGDWARYNRAVENGDHVEVELPLRALNATQKTVNPDFMSVKNDELPAVLRKGGEYYIQDGHHRLMREAASGKQTARVRLYDVDPSTRDPRQLTLLSSNEAAAPVAALEHLTTGQLDDAARAVAGRAYRELDHAQQQRAQKLALETVHARSAPVPALRVAAKVGDRIFEGKLTDYAPKLFAKNESAAPLSALERAPIWYSPVEQALEATTTARATGAQWLATLRNSRGVKPEELDWTGLRQYLEERADQPVSRPELHEYLRDNRVELQDVTKGAQDPVAVRKQAEEELRSAYGAREWRRFSNEEREDLIIEHMEGLQSEHAPEGSTKYHDYALPGGENYREHLITMPIQGRRIGVRPSEEGPLEAYDTATGRTVRNSRGDDNEMLAWAEAENKKGQPTDPREYKSPHWDEPNIVAHVRSNVREMARDREVVSWRNKNSGNESQTFPSEEAAREWLATQRLPTDKLELVKRKLNEPLRSLHLEELQSDWHQAGRRKGYKDENSKAARDEAYNKWSDAYEKNPHSEETKQLRQLYEEAQQHHVDSAGGVPDAPWKKTWHELALRRMIRLAAEEGMDRISWTPGEAQAARYNLSKQIDRLKYDTKLGQLDGFRNGKSVLTRRDVKPEQLPDLVGKDVAEKLMSQKDDAGIAPRVRDLQGQDLKVGGEGMRGFYDKMMVQAAEKLGKEYGVKVVRGNIPDGRRVNKTVDDRYSVTGDSKIYETRAEAEKAASQSIWYFDIPPAMREAVLSKGMPLFSGGKMFVPSGAQRSESDGRD